ncbi:caspase family protein [Leptolyngbya ohadii]|uniref:caspase family protein n=1 Tax=Leptolyngbya ohadii TaxID=1962290 RepID=UPI000B59A314|nr:peptidoglycan-binding protein [Leptolyngbya ohadii]
MLTAYRFTTVPTKDCRTRLEAALANRQPIARGEKHRGAVVAIQSALADLNRGYLLGAEIDGYFGSRTYRAVEAFQRDYGLVADGMVGRQTMMQLDTLYSSDVMRQPRGLSIHIGVDRVDAAHYGDEFALSSCVNDARKMCEIAENLGYSTAILENEDATVSNFTGFMRGAISELVDGDSLLITFSGHGAQIPNNSAEAEADNLDETLCFFDRMLVDDELYALLAQFNAGVRVHAVFDSCHSGTVAKDLLQQSKDWEQYKQKTLQSLQEESPSEHKAAIPQQEESNRPIAPDRIAEALDGEKLEFSKQPEPKHKDEVDRETATLFADLYADEIPTSKNKKQIDENDWTQIYKNNRDLYDAIKNVVGPQEDQELSCSVITLSACQDSQTTPAGRLYSLFTYNIVSTWGARGFEGSYKQLHSQLVNVSRPDSTPAINTYGTNRASARLYDRPFVI